VLSHASADEVALFSGDLARFPWLLDLIHIVRWISNASAQADHNRASQMSVADLSFKLSFS
jgi:hypothetical protein